MEPTSNERMRPNRRLPASAPEPYAPNRINERGNTRYGFFVLLMVCTAFFLFHRTVEEKRDYEVTSGAPPWSIP